MDAKESVDDLASAVAGVQTPWTGFWYPALASTQDAARRLIDTAPADRRIVVVADVQTAGRGRQGRTWSAPAGAALLMSVVFRELHAQPLPWRWTCTASLALVEAIDATAPGLAPAIKWPNDVMLAEAKVAGVLAETTWNGRELIAIVGIGVNVRTSQADLDALGVRASSLASAGASQSVTRADLFRVLVARLDHWSSQPWPAVRTAWSARLWGRGQRVALNETDGPREVVVLGVDDDGALRVRLGDGSEYRTLTGELIA